MMTKLIDAYYRGCINLGVWCFKVAIKLSDSWFEKMEVCRILKEYEDDYLSGHWVVTRDGAAKLRNLRLNTQYEFEREFEKMERIYYGEETA